MTTYDRPPLVLVDMDGVLADLEAGFWQAWSLAHPTAPQREDVDGTEFYIEDQLPEEYRERVRAIVNAPGFYRRLPAVPGAIEAINAMLASGWDVRLCTAPRLTNPTCASDKIAWAEEAGRYWPERTIIARDKGMVRGDLLIDDKPIITTALTPTWKHVVFDRSYNLTAPSPYRLTRWDTWEATLTPLLGRIAA